MKILNKLTLLLIIIFCIFSEANSQNDSLIIYLKNGQQKYISLNKIRNGSFKSVYKDSIQIYLKNSEQKIISLADISHASFKSVYKDSLQVYLKSGEQKIISLADINYGCFKSVYKDSLQVYLKDGEQKIISLSDINHSIFKSVYKDSLQIYLSNGDQKIISLADINHGSFKSVYKDSLQIFLLNAPQKNIALSGIMKVNFEPLSYKQYIMLKKGWNMISSFLHPYEPDAIQNVCKDITDNVIIAKNNNSDVYIPSYNINSIGKWDITQGYQIYMNNDVILNIKGSPISLKQTPISLNSGWNMIAFLRNSELDCETAFASLTENGNLIIVKDNEGNVYIPFYGINTIGNLKPGQGYHIYVIDADVLFYPEN
jgi:uncharacterized Zn ribbon protein